MVVRVPRVGVSLQTLIVEHLARQLFHTLSHLSTLVHTFSHFVLEVQVGFCLLCCDAFQPKLPLDDLYGYWYRVLAGRARRELPREVSNISTDESRVMKV